MENTYSPKDEDLMQIITVLDSIYSLYAHLADIKVKETDVVIKGNVDELKNLVDEQNIIIINLGKLENKRQTLVDDYCKKEGLDSSKITISDLIKIGPYKEELKKLQDGINEKINDVVKYNKKNGMLISKALDFVDKSYNLIKSALTSDGGLYNQGGRGKNSISIIDRKV